MKKTLLSLSCVFVLAGCGSVPSVTSIEYGSWLDRIGKLPNPPVAMSEEDAQALKAQAMALRSEADAIRVLLASEKDRVRRFRHYSDIRKIDDQLAPIERQLAAAGRPSRPALIVPG